MPNQQHGSLEYVFGIDEGYDSIPGIKLESISIEAAPEFEAMAKDLTGTVQAHVIGAPKGNFTASGYLITGEQPVPGFGFVVTIDTVATHFIIERVSESHSNVEFKKLEMSGKSFKLITTGPTDPTP